MLDVFECLDQEHGPETTFVKCLSCKGYVPKVETAPAPAPAPSVAATQAQAQTTAPRRLILKNTLSPGDVLVMSAAIRSLHLTHPGKFLTAVDTSCNALYENNPDAAPLDQARAQGWELVQTHYPAVGESNQRAIHFMQAYCEFLENALGVRVPLRVNRPQIFLSDAEKSWMSQVQEITGNSKKYVVVNSGVKRDYTAKSWPWYQEVVDQLQGRVLFVQVGKTEHLHRPLRGAINLLDKTDDRQLARLVYHSQGVLCGTTYLMHLAAALEKPSVIPAGGREPRAWNQYQLSTVISTVGALDCCKKSACWRSRTVALGDNDDKDKKEKLCENPTFTEPPAPKCMAIISPKEVAEKISWICS